MKILRRCTAALLLLMIVGVLLLWLKPPGLLRVGAAYAAKIVCSNVFLAGRNADDVLRLDVQASGIPLLGLMRVSLLRERGVVRAGFLGFIGDGVAVARPGKGCTVLATDDPTLRAAAAGASPPARTPPEPTSGAASWPDGGQVDTRPALERILNDDELAGPGARAIVVVDHGRIVAERYTPGFTADTPLLGWSMTKTVTAGLIGMLVKDGKLALDQSGLWPADGSGRDRIRVADLLAMSSGLRFNEGHAPVSDLTTMLYLVPDMAAFARSQPLTHPVGEFWSYSSGTGVMLARIMQDAAGAPDFVEQRLFKPLGMTSATIETDEHGTLVGSSYMYATARDWAKFAQFLLQNGVWHGQALLPPGYVEMMATPVAASAGQYGHGQVWLNPDAAPGIPKDTFWMTGYDGQNIAVVRSRQLIVVRLGLTPYLAHYSPQPLLQAVLQSTAEAST
jgi:CubicO group peptidase (beta-lactamase class C family)